MISARLRLRPNWLIAVRRYLIAIAFGSLLWETAQMPLYTLWRTGTAAAIAQAVLHCTLGDVLIATVALVAALAVVGSPAWPNERLVSVAVAVVIVAVSYTAYSEYVNTSVRRGRHADPPWMLSWLAPVDGVLNVFVAPTDAPGDAVPVTRDRGRGVRIYGWTYAGGLVFLQDVGGDEDFHLFGVDPINKETRDFTPFAGVRAGIAAVSRQLRGELLVSLNKRDKRFHDLFTLDLGSGALELVEENPGLAG
jgi:hypothetical protein